MCLWLVLSGSSYVLSVCEGRLAGITTIGSCFPPLFVCQLTHKQTNNNNETAVQLPGNFRVITITEIGLIAGMLNTEPY